MKQETVRIKITLKVWWRDATLLVYFIFSSTYTHSITFIQYINLSPFAEVPLHLLIAGQEKHPWGAELKIELGTALEQADALPFELRRTLF